METYIIIAVCVLAAIGIIVGFALGYVRQSSWGGTVVGTVLTCFVVDRALGQNDINFGQWHGFIMLAIALGVLIFYTLLCGLVRRFLNNQIGKSKRLSFYRDYDEEDENEQRILWALDKNDKKTYRKRSRRNFKRKRGPWGVVDRIFGAITLTVNIFAALAVVATLALIIIDACKITAAYDYLSRFYEGPFWQGQGAALAVDMLVVALMCICLRIGYNSGIISVLSLIVILGILGGACYLAYYLVFDVGAFSDAATGVYNAVLAGPLEGSQAYLDNVGLTADVIGKIIITVGLAVVLLIPAIIISIFVPRLFDLFRSFTTLEVIDGAIGAIVLTAVIFAILAFLGAVLWYLRDLEGLAIFNDYMQNSHVADGLYGENGLTSLGFIRDFGNLLREWLGLAPM